MEAVMHGPDFMDFNEVIEQIIKATGRNRKQAVRELLRALASGELPSEALNAETGQVERVPPEMFKGLKTEEDYRRRFPPLH
jgi:hypothetical protein